MSKIKGLATNLRTFFNKLTVKQVILIIIFGVAISVASCIIGYIEFSNTIKNNYDHEAYEIANFIKKNIDIPEYEQDMRELRNVFYEDNSPVFEQISRQPGYQKLVEQANNLENSFDGLEIFIGNFEESYKDEYLKYLEAKDNITTPDQEAMSFIKDDGDEVVSVYYRSPSLIPGTRKPNQPGGLFLASAGEKDSVQNLYKDKKTQYLDTEMILGDTKETFTQFSVNEPILTDSGDMVGYVNVSIRIAVLQQLLSRYLFLVGCLTILIGVIFIIIYIHINRRLFLKPILRIINDTQYFVENNNQISDDLTEIKTGDEIQVLAESIIKLEKDINDYIDNLETITAERERVQTELDLATNIQMSMLPQTFPAFPDRDEFDIYALMDPAREVGGDFYNFFLIDDDHLGVVIGDVSGKGVPAALFMMIGNILIKAQSLPERQANEIIEKANDILSDNNAEMLFITSWMGIYEISTNTITFVNAGHEPPLLIHENGESEFINTKPNMVLGSFGGLPYRLNEAKLQKGDKIFLYTDGVPEAQNEAQEFYGSDRFVDVVENNYSASIEEIVKRVRQNIDDFVQEAEQFDDITIVGLEVKEGPKGE